MSCPEMKNVCPPVPPPRPKDDLTDVAAMMEAMGGKIPCYTDGSSSGGGGGGIVPALAVAAYTSNQKNISHGCSQLQALAQEYKLAQTNITCTLNQSCNKSYNTLNAQQLIKFECADDVIINNINQNMSVKMISELKLSDEDVNKIDAELKTFNKQFADMLQDKKDGYLSTQPGQRQALQVKTNVESLSYATTIKQAITEFNNAMSVGQTIDIKGKKRCIATGDITQNMQLEMLATSILNSSMTNNFKTIMEATNEQDSKMIQKSKESDSKMWTTIIIAVVIGLVVIVLLVIAFKAFSKKTDMAQQFAGQMMSPPPQPQGYAQQSYQSTPQSSNMDLARQLLNEYKSSKASTPPSE